MSSRGNSWTDLNEALLDKIFTLVCSPQGGPNTPEVPFKLNANIPLTCRRFHACYKSSPTLWRRVELDWLTAINPPTINRSLSRADDRNTPHTYYSTSASGSSGRDVMREDIPRFGYISRWLLTRAPLIQHLTLTNCHVLGPALEIQLLPLCTQATRLVSIQLLDYKGSGDEILAALVSSPCLRQVKITCYQPSRGYTIPLRISEAAVQGLARLNSLESVDLEVDSLMRTTNFLVRSPTQEGKVGSTWSKLEKLKSFRLSGRMESVVLHPEMLSALKNLQNLELVNVRLPQFSPAMVNSLSSVSYLSLTNILAAKPRRKSGFALWNALPGLRSLKKLVIKGAGKDADVPRSVLACSALESLTIQDCNHVGNWPFSTEIGHSTTNYNAFPAVNTLKELHLIDIGLFEMPSSQFWERCRQITSLTWRNVHHAAPRHRYWDHDGPCEITHTMESVIRRLRVLKLEYTGWQSEEFNLFNAEVARVAKNLEELSLEGNRFGPDSEASGEILYDMIFGKPIVRLSLVNCGLGNIPAVVFMLAPSLTELDLTQNPNLEASVRSNEMLKGIKVVKRDDRQALLAASLPTLLEEEHGRGRNRSAVALQV